MLYGRGGKHRWKKENDIIRDWVNSDLDDISKIESALLWMERRGYVKRRTLGSCPEDRTTHYKLTGKRLGFC